MFSSINFRVLALTFRSKDLLQGHVLTWCETRTEVCLFYGKSSCLGITRWSDSIPSLSYCGTVVEN